MYPSASPFGADAAGALYYAGGIVTHTDDGNPGVRGTRLAAIKAAGLAVGMSCVAGVYGPVTYTSVQAVNSNGTAVGTGVRPGAAAPDGYTAVVWSGSHDSPRDLAAIQPLAPAGCWNVHATDISEAGAMLTDCNDTSGGFCTWLASPAP